MVVVMWCVLLGWSAVQYRQGGFKSGRCHSIQGAWWHEPLSQLSRRLDRLGAISLSVAVPLRLILCRERCTPCVPVGSPCYSGWQQSVDMHCMPVCRNIVQCQALGWAAGMAVGTACWPSPLGMQEVAGDCNRTYRIQGIASAVRCQAVRRS